ncbi:hypothetical protein ACP3TD_00530 [Pseudarthrobacter sp. 1G09]|uniref:hypothetical protein n=1 Tax=Pseudarthrobacter sp. 1G09 TaxID=3416178 RepID=UPI003CF5154C
MGPPYGTQASSWKPHWQRHTGGSFTGMKPSGSNEYPMAARPTAGVTSSMGVPQ